MKAADATSQLEHLCKLDIDSSAPLVRQTGIICTIGPVSQKPEILVKMMKTGMNVARLNFSHGSYEYHAETIKNVREAVDIYSKELGAPHALAIALDTKGPEIRTGLIDGSGSAEVELKKGETIKLTTNPEFADKGNKDQVYVDYKNIVNVVQPGNRIFIDDGLISLICESKVSFTICCLLLAGLRDFSNLFF